MRLRILACLFALIVAVQAVSAAPQVEISLWHRWSGVNQEILTKLLRNFEAQNPTIKVKDEVKVGEYLVMLQKVMADMAAGNPPPDVLLGSYNYLDFISSELQPIPIDKLGSSKDVAKIYSRFDPAILGLGKMGSRQVAIPFAISNIVLYYNPEIFKAAGLDPRTPPRNWDEVFSMGRIIKQKTGKPAIVIQKMDDWSDQSLIYSAGGKLLSPDGKKVAFNDPGTVEAYTMWAKLHKEGLSPVGTDEELQASFVAGDLGMYCTTIMKLLSQRKMAKFELGVAPFPVFVGKPQKLAAGGAAITVFAKNKQKQAAILKLIDFLTSDASMQEWTKTGYLCITKAKVPVSPGQEIAYAQLSMSAPWQAMPGGSTGLEIDKIFIDTRTKIIYGSLDPKAGLDKAVSDCNKLLQ
jgi:multiple sugar transport system substrate-binding protein